mmetsp:Transcript_11387/g.26298  ORF Transcript_11387/g.26298 Transcript_11387/m.26298 type:complete len:167 (-) Transcript_11387:230-730(-)
MASMLDAIGVRGRPQSFNRVAGQVRVDEYEYQIEMDKEKVEEDPLAGQKKAQDERNKELADFRADQKARKRTKRAVVQKEPEKKLSLPSFIAVKSSKAEVSAQPEQSSSTAAEGETAAPDAKRARTEEEPPATAPAEGGGGGLGLVGYASDDSSDAEDDDDEGDEE